jgi:hypothetical protein
MRRSFRFVALESDRFAPLFSATDEELRALNARRQVVDESPGFPCRVSLADAEVGETVLLVPFVHHDVSSPYRGSGPIFVRMGATTATPEVNEVPPMFRHRRLSIRAYDAGAMMVAAEVAQGSELETVIERLFANDEVSYLHVHNAGPGCYACRVARA